MSDHEEPFWRVQTVYDPEGLGRDFAYTVGLAERGVPELHLWARPSLGEDPGADWNLSLLDAARILNEAAWRLLEGDLPVGATWEHEYDAGFVTARFVVQEAVPADEVEAFASGDVPVLPVRWSLDRDPLGPLVAMTSDAQEEAERLHWQVLGHIDDDLAPTPPGWPGPVSLDWSAEQDLGPRTPLVLARAAQVWNAGADALIDQASNAIILHGRRQPGYAVLVARAAARPAGRVDVLDRVSEAATRLVADLGEGWGAGPYAALRDYMIGDMGDAPVEDREAVMRGIRSALTEQVQALLVTEAAADLMPAWAVVWGQGPTLTALGSQGLPPEDRFRCSPEVAEAVRGLVTGCIVDDVVRASVAWHETQGSEHRAVARDHPHHRCDPRPAHRRDRDPAHRLRHRPGAPGGPRPPAADLPGVAQRAGGGALRAGRARRQRRRGLPSLGSARARARRTRRRAAGDGGVRSSPVTRARVRCVVDAASAKTPR